jgi:hypothetical protein
MAGRSLAIVQFGMIGRTSEDPIAEQRVCQDDRQNNDGSNRREGLTGTQRRRLPDGAAEENRVRPDANQQADTTWLKRSGREAASRA